MSNMNKTENVILQYTDDKNLSVRTDLHTKYSVNKQGLKNWLFEQYKFEDNFRILELGCGYGWHCRYAIEKGASAVLGIDSSEKMIQKAIQKNHDAKITYQVMSIDMYDYPEKTFDCVISNLAMHYLEELESVFRLIYRTLKDKGLFLMNIEHPVFTAGVNQDWHRDEKGSIQHWPLDSYFYPGKRITRFLGYEVIKQHHTLSQILMGLINAGFKLEVIEEAIPDESVLNIAGMRDELRRPMMLLIRALKEGQNAL